MYINDISILYYLFVGIIGLYIGQLVDWFNMRLIDHKRIISKEFFTIYLKKIKLKYLYIITVSVLYLIILYKYHFSITALKFFLLVPMLLSVFVIDYREKIIPNRLNLTIFETGLFFAFVEGIFNINIAIDMLLGMFAGAGVFLIITLIGGLIAGKEAMGLGDVKLMGGLGLFFGWRTIIIISLIAFLLGAIIGIALIAIKRKESGEYIPFGPFIVAGALIAIIVPFNILLIVLLKIFTLGTLKT